MDIGIKFRAHACSPITGNKVVFKNAVNQAREPPWLSCLMPWPDGAIELRWCCHFSGVRDRTRKHTKPMSYL